MSWHYLQEEGVAFSLQNYLDGIQFAPSSTTRDTEIACCKDSETVCSKDSLYGTTSEHLMESRGEGKLTCLAEGFHAKVFRQRVKVKDLPMNVVDYGRNINDLLARLDLTLSLPKTAHYCERVGLARFSKTLPAWGMMRDGVIWELASSGRTKGGRENGLLPSLSGVNGGKNHIAGRLDEWGGSSNPFRGTPLASWHVPRFEEWMMGWPETWAAQTGFEMDRYQLWLQMHSEF